VANITNEAMLLCDLMEHELKKETYILFCSIF